MKHYGILFVIALIGFLLVGCTGSSSLQAEHKRNPLVQEYIGDMMVEYVATKRIHAEEAGAPITDSATLRALDAALVEGKRLRAVAYKAEDAGKMGTVYGVNDYFAKGEVLLEQSNVLHFGYTFEIDAAPDLVVYLASHVSPRTEKEMKEEEWMKIGELQSMYGAQTYDVPRLTQTQWDALRTVVFFSESLQEVIAIAQIRGQ